MASLMRSVLRRDSSIGERSAATSPRSPKTITSVPSFSDFSMHAASDADQAFDATAGATASPFVGAEPCYRGSLDAGVGLFRSHSEAPGGSPFDPRRASVDSSLRSNSWVPSAAPALQRVGYLFPRTAAIPIPSSPPAVKTHAGDADKQAPPATAPAGRRGSKYKTPGQIDGLDYYEFCELIRSSSL